MAIGGEWLERPTSGPVSPRGLSAFGLLALIVFGLGLAVGARMTAEEPEGGTATQSAPAPGPHPGPTSVASGVPVGFARTEEGAVAAARAFLEASGSSLMADGAAYRDALVTMAAPAWRPRAEEIAANASTFLSEWYGPGGDAFIAPVALEVAEFTGDEARVQVWAVNVLSGPRRPAGEQAWSVTSIDLAWVGGDWRIARLEQQGSPAPALVGEVGSVRELVQEFDPDA